MAPTSATASPPADTPPLGTATRFETLTTRLIPHPPSDGSSEERSQPAAHLVHGIEVSARCGRAVGAHRNRHTAGLVHPLECGLVGQIVSGEQRLPPCERRFGHEGGGRAPLADA